MNTSTIALKQTASCIIAAATMLAVGACSSDAPATPSLDTDGVVIITNAHANVPMPALSKVTAQLTRDALDQGLPVLVISADGTPAPVAMPDITVDTSNSDRHRRSLEWSVGMVAAHLTAYPDADGANSYDALGVGVNEARADGMKRPTFVCVLCGLDTTGPMDMTFEGALSADASAYIEHLTATGQLLRFDGFDTATVILQSTGVTTPPQEYLAPADQARLTEVWSAVLAEGGATVQIDPHTLGGDPIETELTVPTVDVPERPQQQPIAACEPQEFSFDGASGARFVAETDQWVDEAEARDALAPLASWLVEDRSRSATIAGTTADILSGDPEEGKQLSLARAQAAAQLLIELGVAPEQITEITGLGPHYPGRIEDRDASGNPIRQLRTKNRKVLIHLSAPC